MSFDTVPNISELNLSDVRPSSLDLTLSDIGMGRCRWRGEGHLGPQQNMPPNTHQEEQSLIYFAALPRCPTCTGQGDALPWRSQAHQLSQASELQEEESHLTASLLREAKEFKCFLSLVLEPIFTLQFITSSIIEEVYRVASGLLQAPFFHRSALLSSVDTMGILMDFYQMDRVSV